MNTYDFSEKYFNGLKNVIEKLSFEQIDTAIECIKDAYKTNKQVFIIGNGGSAATASHMANDLGKGVIPEAEPSNFKRFRVLSLTDNVSWITALGNDIGYEYIFSEQLKNFCQPGDLVIAITGSGNSPNIIEAIRKSKNMHAKTIGILGFDGGKVLKMVDHYILVESNHYGFVEDVHMIFDHLITAYFKDYFAKS